MDDHIDLSTEMHTIDRPIKKQKINPSMDMHTKNDQDDRNLSIEIENIVDRSIKYMIDNNILGVKLYMDIISYDESYKHYNIQSKINILSNSYLCADIIIKNMTNTTMGIYPKFIIYIFNKNIYPHSHEFDIKENHDSKLRVYHWNIYISKVESDERKKFRSLAVKIRAENMNEMFNDFVDSLSH